MYCHKLFSHNSEQDSKSLEKLVAGQIDGQFEYLSKTCTIFARMRI